MADSSSPRNWKPLARLARERGFSPRVLRRAARRGELDHARPGQRIVYSTDTAVDAWLRKQQLPVTPTAEARAKQIAESIH